MTLSVISVLHPITRLIVGGAQENTLYTAARLNKDRYQVTVVCGPQTGPEGSLIQKASDMGVSLTIIPELVREIHPWKDLGAFWRLYHCIKAGGYKIVHTHSSKAGILGRLAAWFARVPVIVHTVHGWSFHDRMGKIRRGLFVLLEKIMARLCDTIIVVAAQDMDKGLVEGIGQRSQYQLVRSAIPLEFFSPDQVDRLEVRRELGIPADAPVIGNVGRLSPQKNPFDWIKVASLVFQQSPACWFLLVGDGPLRANAENLATELGVAQRMIFTGIRTDVDRMLAAMDVFVLTSLWEGLPRVIPQALAMKVPVVAYRVDGTVEAIQHGVTGYLCDPGKLELMAAYCLDLLCNESLRQQIGRRGRAFAVQEFNIDQMIVQIEVIYENLLQKKLV